jgi:hypothetical protein
MADEKDPEDTGSAADAPPEHIDPEQEFWTTDPGELADVQRGGKEPDVTKEAKESPHELRERATEQPEE